MTCTNSLEQNVSFRSDYISYEIVAPILINITWSKYAPGWRYQWTEGVVLLGCSRTWCNDLRCRHHSLGGRVDAVTTRSPSPQRCGACRFALGSRRWDSTRRDDCHYLRKPNADDPATIWAHKPGKRISWISITHTVGKYAETSYPSIIIWKKREEWTSPVLKRTIFRIEGNLWPHMCLLCLCHMCAMFMSPVIR